MTQSWKLISTGLLALALSVSAGTTVLSPDGKFMPSALAEVPTGVPVFTSPLEFDNDFFPFKEGAIKVYTGRERNVDITIVEFHLMDTRTFQWDGKEIDCRIIRESAFVDGELAETSFGYYAQADDGSVYGFGEVSYENLLGQDDDDEDDPDEEDDPDHSWVVGAIGEDDPEDTLTTPDPFVEMPATPTVGDSWEPEAIEGNGIETFEVTRESRRVRVPAGRFRHCLQLSDSSSLSNGSETKWFAPGIGYVKGRAKGESARLLASTLGSR